MDKLLISSVHPASAKRQLANHLQVLKMRTLFFTYPIVEDVNLEYDGRHCSEMQIPLHLAWAVTIHKSHGLTMSKVQIGLGKKEFCAGLTFVMLSRSKDLGGLLILNGLDYSRVKNFGGAALNVDIALHNVLFFVPLLVMHAHMRSEQNGPCTVYISLCEAEAAEEQSDDASGEAPSDGGGSEA
ncbi:hypothetical protein K435DRAFT_860952 [Dendrothele bispora CBS 962.96]|uniref:ATP-dependent DNA helicase n=1 Tax=Dendrothele bispora (strain CBS 962.96) TaxID=1314807 RepID=A0A4S8LWQ4_DENBC|nr:hypothetical protein K435DRAFT_860952 [Dendrothele bispora CBS 962.96]